MTKIAIIGASYLQEPLIRKAQAMNIETHVFAWRVGDVGEKIADYFYPISIIEKDQILKKCQEIGIDGICSIASDLASITVNYVANRMGLVGNSEITTMLSTNKFEMKKCFLDNGIRSARFYLLDDTSNIDKLNIHFPVIVKPTDRSGSRGVTKVCCLSDLKLAAKRALDLSFEKKILIEEFIEGNEFSVEFLSHEKKHHFIAVTQKYTTGEPYFIEKGHSEPTVLDEETIGQIKQLVCSALNCIGFENGASHTEVKIDSKGRISVIELGGRMGGDHIGSYLVPISTGIDFVRAVIQVAVGKQPELASVRTGFPAAIRYITREDDFKLFYRVQDEHPEYLYKYEIDKVKSEPVLDSSSRYGYFILKAKNLYEIQKYI